MMAGAGPVAMVVSAAAADNVFDSEGTAGMGSTCTACGTALGCERMTAESGDSAAAKSSGTVSVAVLVSTSSTSFSDSTSDGAVSPLTAPTANSPELVVTGSVDPRSTTIAESGVSTNVSGASTNSRSSTSLGGSTVSPLTAPTVDSGESAVTGSVAPRSTT